MAVRCQQAGAASGSWGAREANGHKAHPAGQSGSCPRRARASAEAEEQSSTGHGGGGNKARSLANEGPSVLGPTVRQHLQPRGPLGHLTLPAAKGAERHNHRHRARGQAQLPRHLWHREGEGGEGGEGQQGQREIIVGMCGRMMEQLSGAVQERVHSRAAPFCS